MYQATFTPSSGPNITTLLAVEFCAHYLPQPIEVHALEGVVCAGPW